MNKRFVILDTNVLMHDPMALFAFNQDDIFLPMTVLEELDAGKKGLSEVSRNVRETNRLLDNMIDGLEFKAIQKGVPIVSPLLAHQDIKLGRLFFETEPMLADLPEALPRHIADNHIIQTGLALRKRYPNRQITLVTKDINMRIKASAVGLHAEDYIQDQTIEDSDLLYKGYKVLDKDFFNLLDDLESWQENGHTYYKLQLEKGKEWAPNECLLSASDPNFRVVVREVKDGVAKLEFVKNYLDSRKGIWGVNARNEEQNLALNLLLDDEVDFVSLLGQAGTGKTLLTLAAALHQVFDMRKYNEIIMTRATIPLGEDIGFLPGTEEEKMTPWMGALMDNLEVLTTHADDTKEAKEVTTAYLSSLVKIKSMNFMRGRTFLNKFIIIDEAQNLTPKQMKALITRAGPGTKVVCLGNIGQIDSPYLTETTNGLTYAVNRFKGWKHGGHITLTQSVRSRLAEYASENL